MQLENVFIIDPCHVSREALADIVRSCVQNVNILSTDTFSDLTSQVLIFSPETTLVITELRSGSEGVSQGIRTIENLITLRLRGLHIIVFTAARDPFLLGIVKALCPSVLLLRIEQLVIIELAIKCCLTPLIHTILSPEASEVLRKNQHVTFTPREVEWFIAQADGHSIKETAVLMKVAYKTATATGYNVYSKTNENSFSFSTRMAVLRMQMGLMERL